MSVASLLPARPAKDLRPIALGALVAFAALVGGIGAANLSPTGRALRILGLVVILLPLILRAIPAAGVVVLVLMATLVEQLPVPLPQFGGIGTDQIFYFTSLNDGIGIGGVLATPLELTMAMILATWAVRAIGSHSWRLRKSQLLPVVAILMGIILVAAARGLLQGADLRTDLREIRPWVYVGVAYLIASQLLHGREAVWAVLWAFVIGAGIKGTQGTLRFFSLDLHPRPDYIISHEEAFFLTLFLLLTATLWIFGERGRLRQVATTFLPLVLLADLANARRTAWVIFGAGFIALVVIAWIRLPQRRSLIRRGAFVLVVASLIYLPVFWSSTAIWAEPARAIKSSVFPDQRDRDSNVYRQLENANLLADIKASTPIGTGFGIPIDYSAIPFHDLSDQVPALRFVPHNGVLYIWMVLGIPGALAFWWLIGSTVVLAGRVIRAPDRRLAIFGAFSVCAVIAYLMEGYYDFGLWWFRVALLMGCLLGALEAALHASPDPLRNAAVRRHDDAGRPTAAEHAGGAL
ncbi:MAG TPA: O-antigen ligase family protein [Candidatus Dormibacteraeota bacterium]|nr:O-antigen ligase family protein [Candidatus Dormibacteraeota bacterium]